METGHAKNVANFETTLIILTGLGADYEPNQELIQLRLLQPILTQSKNALTEIDTAQAEKTVKVDEAQEEFADLDKYVRNIKNNARIELNDEAFTADLQAIVNRFAPPGRKTGLKDDPATPEDESRTAHSMSQQSRDNQIANLAEINALLKSRTDYATTETEYTTTAIDAKIASLTVKNNAAKAAESQSRQQTRCPRPPSLRQRNRNRPAHQTDKSLSRPKIRQRQRTIPTNKRARISHNKAVNQDV